MQFLGLGAPAVAAALLIPSFGLALLGLMGDAPGEWGRGALIAWTALAAALLAGAALQAGAGVLAWAPLLLGLVAVMTGGPPGLILVALAALALLTAGPAAPSPRWLALVLTGPPLVLGVRQLAA